MASAARSAPLPESGSALVEDPQFQEILQRSRSLTQKILDSIADTHSSCVHTETLKLDSSDIGRFSTMATNIGIPPAPVLSNVSENFTLETSLRVMHDGLQLHQGLLSSIAPRLAEKDKVVALMSDVRDLKIQITKMKKMNQSHTAAPPTSGSVELRLPGEFEVQVAAHLTLVQLKTFSRDVARCLRSLDHSTAAADNQR
ncbi:colony stimulating factor 3 (granulocyte) a [Gambusia affinis]|uniref:colony stimulating factor 3 (granulocyte) a n=1 Tax=Gambusia affinis TaxID=33528 RepID=UPI001CDD14A9|nr:colony stimulating factor 3 (granulocyte) a [Gambusia affinis]